MVQSPPRWCAAVLFLIAALLGGCCANNECNCDDAQADAIELRFSADTLGSTGRGFRVADQDTLVLKRYPLPYNPVGKFDSVTIYRRARQARDSVVINNGAPFGQQGTAKLNAYRYTVQYLAHPPKKGRRAPVLVIQRVQLRGSLVATGCCTCYTNAEKTVFATVYRGGVARDTVVDLKQRPYLLLTK